MESAKRVCCENQEKIGMPELLRDLTLAKDNCCEYDSRSWRVNSKAVICLVHGVGAQLHPLAFASEECSRVLVTQFLAFFFLVEREREGSTNSPSHLSLHEDQDCITPNLLQLMLGKVDSWNADAPLRCPTSQAEEQGGFSAVSLLSKKQNLLDEEKLHLHDLPPPLDLSCMGHCIARFSS